MSWFHRKSKQHPQELNVLRPHFLSEQDGGPERELKARLVEFFHRDQSVVQAYLARVAYGDRSSASVALCVRSKFGPDLGLAEKIGRIFASIFGAHEHLDIIFIDDNQESELEKVCPPFFAIQ